LNKEKQKSYSRYFLLGTALGFLLCTGIGQMLTTSPLAVPSFIRFHEYINPNGGFYLTYNEMLAQARKTMDEKPGRKLLIIGGDSVFYGEGQSIEHCWTIDLQEELDKLYPGQYAVLNLALPGTKVFEAGNWVYEKLKREGKDVLLVTNAMPSTVFEPSGTIPLHYMFFDAVERGALDNFAERLSFAEKHKEWSLFQDDSHGESLKLRALFNHYLAAEELWTRFTYYVMGNYYHRSTAAASLLPRRLFKDPFIDRPTFDRTDVEKLDHGISQVRKFLAGITALYEGGKASEYEQFFWRRLRGCTQCAVPASSRDSIIVAITAINPLFIDELSAREKADYLHIKKLWRENFERCGFKTIELNETLASENYVDFDHLNPAGGKLMAKELAARLRDKSND
jgi:hypothetical protein